MRRSWCCVIAVLIWAINAYADGVYIYRAKPPAIPSQRAIIVYKDGIERLQVESLVQSEGDSLAWILPVPATPTGIKEVSPGFLKTLALNIKPKFKGGPAYAKRCFFAVVAAVLIGVWALFVLLAAPGQRATVSLAVVAFLIGVLAMVGVFLFSSTRGAAGMLANAVRVEKASVVVNYEVSVLDAPNAAALDAWLTQNGFAALPEAGKDIAADYIKEGWRFVTAKLRTEAGQLLRPHPLELSFPAKRAVYPMRLTALADCDVYLELYVIANQAAGASGLTAECIDRVQRMVEPQQDEAKSEPRASLGRTSINHPATADYLWEGCAVTRLDGTLGPAQMEKDILFEFSDAANTRKTYFTLEARSQLAWTWACAIGALVLIVRTLTATFKETRPLRRKAIVIGAGMAVLTGAVVWGVCRIALPAREAVLVGGNEGHLESLHMQYSEPGAFLFTVLDFGEVYPGLEKLPVSELASLVRAHFTYTPIFDMFTGKRIILEDSPGNMLIESDENRVVVKTFSRNGKVYLNDIRQILENERGNGRMTSSFPATLDAKGLERTFQEWREHPGHGDRSAYLWTMYAIARDPQGLAGPPIGIIQEYCDGQKMPAFVLEIAVGGLGLATETVPPADLTDRAALKAFLVEVQSRLKNQAANPGA